MTRPKLIARSGYLLEVATDILYCLKKNCHQYVRTYIGWNTEGDFIGCFISSNGGAGSIVVC